MLFKSKTYGILNIDQIAELIAGKIKEDPCYSYVIALGSDSQNTDKTKLVEVIALQKVGKGGIFFYNIEKLKKISPMHRRLLLETERTIDLARELTASFEDLYLKKAFDINDYKISFQVHCDIGEGGKSKNMIREIVGYVKGVTDDNFEVKIKPDSFCASSIADKLSK